MKRNTICNTAAKLVLFLLITNASFAQPQGKVVINEYMTWPSSGCGTTSEFVELLNFGPGPVDVGCYILTTGVYSVTIPPNTILLPGQFYVIAGRDFIPGTCANIDSAATGIHANLNWNTCNCTNVPIPQTGAGMMADGGSANTPLVLLSPSLEIIDAVVRNTPTETVGTVTSASIPGSCTGQTFNIGTMNPNYEILGMSAGRGNSFARAMDGDCNWLKETQQSGNATNNRSGRTTDISYDFDMVKPTSCDESGYGNVSIYVKHSNYASIFPMSYTISLDVNNDGIYDFSDQYETYTDHEPPFIEIENLPVGRFKVTVYSVKGCYLANFDFTIIPCDPNTLPVRLLYFKNGGSRQAQHHLEWLVQETQNLQSIVVEKGTAGGRFVSEKIFSSEGMRGNKLYTYAAGASAGFPLYRLQITPKAGRPFYSPVVNTASGAPPPPVRIGPNPATDRLYIQFSNHEPQPVGYTIYNNNGGAVKKGTLAVAGSGAAIPLQSLAPGAYLLQLSGLTGEAQPIPFRFVKH